jgi:type I restriction enzyme R subunit
VEAKRERKNVSAAVDQSERYARNILLEDGEAEASGGPWDAYRVLFVFATNLKHVYQRVYPDLNGYA